MYIDFLFNCNRIVSKTIPPRHMLILYNPKLLLLQVIEDIDGFNLYFMKLGQLC